MKSKLVRLGTLAIALLSVMVFVLSPQPVRAAPATYTWTGTTDSVWTTATNWTPTRTTPATDDILVFDGSSISAPTVTGFPSKRLDS